MVGTREIKYPGWTNTSTAARQLLIYQGVEEENVGQKSPGPPGWGLMQRASSLLIVKKQEMLKNSKHQASETSWFPEDSDSC